MDFISQKKAGRKIKLLILLLGLLPQMLRIILSCIYQYEVLGNHEHSQILGELCFYGANILGQFSFFSILGMLIYLSARNGVAGGIELPILVIGVNVAMYYLQSAISNVALTFAILCFSAIVTVIAIILSAKKHKGVFALSAAILAIPIIGGIPPLYAMGGVPLLDDILFLMFYALLTVGFNLLLILVSCKTASLLNKSAKTDISFKGKMISMKNPALLTMLIFDVLYIIISLIAPTVEIIEEIKEYGQTINSSDWMGYLGVYAEHLIIFVIGYASMRLAAGLVAGVYARAEEEV